MDWLDLLAAQGTQESSPTPQFKSINSLALSLLMVQHSHPYMTTGKTIALTIQIFVGKVMSLLFNKVSRLVITFLPRSKCLLISWLQSPSAVILEPPKNKVSHCFYCFPIYLLSSDGTGWRRQWHPAPVLLPRKSHGWRSLVGCSLWSREELDTTEWLQFHFSLSCIGEGNGNPLQCSCLENPRDEGAGGLQSLGSHRVRHDWSYWAQ